MAMHRMQEVTSVADLGSDITVPVFAVEATKMEAKEAMMDIVAVDEETREPSEKPVFYAQELVTAFKEARKSVIRKDDYAYVVINIIKG